ncbi:MAG: hypothetical protein ABSA76_06665 [Bacteroidales bacterium]
MSILNALNARSDVIYYEKFTDIIIIAILDRVILFHIFTAIRKKIVMIKD